MSIAVEKSLGDFFRDAVGQAARTQKIEVTEEAFSYLVSLLSDFAHPSPFLESTFARPLAFLLDEALQTSGPDRFRRLRGLGDGVLYVTGFFGDHIETKGVDALYVKTVGATAYANASAMIRGAEREPNVFVELAEKFGSCVKLLTGVAENTLAQQSKGERGSLRLYEKWLKGGSVTIAAELTSRGIVPTRGSGGVH